jgi:hypothetical protein
MDRCLIMTPAPAQPSIINPKRVRRSISIWARLTSRGRKKTSWKNMANAPHHSAPIAIIAGQ